MARPRRGAGEWHPPVLTTAIIAAVVATAVWFRVVIRDLPVHVGRQYGFSGRRLLDGRVDSLLSSQLLTRDKFMLLSMVASLAVMLGLYEVLAGSKRAALVAGSGLVAGPLGVTLLLGIGSAAHIEFATRTLSTIDYGASAMTAASGGALVAILGRRWLRAAAVVFVVSGIFVHHQLADWEHLLAFPTGYGVAVLLHGRGPRVARSHPWRGRPAPSTAAPLAGGEAVTSTG
jgi:hypothetical protein